MNKRLNAKVLSVLLASCLLSGFAVEGVALPNGLVSTGTTGLSMILGTVIGMDYVIIYYVFTLLILIATYLFLGKKDAANILFLSILYPATLWAVRLLPLQLIFGEKLVAAACYGLLIGVSTGLSMRVGYSYGGSDTLSKILKYTVFKSVELKTILLGVESVVIFLMLLVYNLDVVGYAFVAQVVCVYSFNYVIFSVGPKLYEIQIIAETTREIEHYIIEELHKGITIHEVTGGYSGERKIQMDCVLTSKEYVSLREYLKEKDSGCFMKVMPLVNVFGQHKDFHRFTDENL